jgi:hypothetical protein
VKELLRRPDDAAKLAAVALGEIGRFDWNRIAEQTIAVYQNVLHEREAEGKSEQLPAPLSSDL